ncbi:MAG TPA: 4'-phosphopantetheinyl transferase superfamily protein [Candidatus Microsaccharimonas sp.]|jgi:phosphopantetheinyl transferase
MYRVIIIDISLIDSAVTTNAMHLLSPTELTRYKNYRHESDARLFLFGRYLTKHLIASHTRQHPAAIVIVADTMTEKPYERHHKVEFSISHSGNYVAVAVAIKPVGLDIQIHDQKDFTIFDTFFNNDERTYAHQSPRHFYQLWTAIESLAKVTGLGFNESLKKRKTTIEKAVENFTLDDTLYVIHEPRVNETLTLSIVTVEPVLFVPEQINDLPGLDQAIIYSASGNTDAAV